MRTDIAKNHRTICGNRRAGVFASIYSPRAVCAAVVAVLICLGAGRVKASESAAESEPNVHRSMRTIPRRFDIHPSGATVAVNQTQKFGVTDAQGRPVAVHWNVSGLGCYGATCGDVDEHGIYHPPASLPKPRVVTLEGVIVSDPRYSVLTQIHLEEAADAASGNFSQPVAGKQEPSPAPVVETQEIASKFELPPLPRVVAASPAFEKQRIRTSENVPLPLVVGAAPNVSGRDLSSGAEKFPLPHAIAAAPTVEGQDTRTVEVVPLPSVIAAAPAISSRDISNNTELLPLPHVIAAAPPVERQSVRSVELVPLPSVVAAAPSVNGRDLSSAGTLPLPHVIAAAPSVEKQSTRSADSVPLPTAVAAAPAVSRRDLSSNKTDLPPIPHAIASAPEVATLDIGRSTGVLPMPTAANPPTAPRVSPAKAQPSVPPVVAKHDGKAAPLKLPDTIVAPGTETTAGAQLTTSVSYKNGQLTIDARNSTLADVLKLVAEKTGATIDVPPGTGQEKIYEHAGPGKPNDVLTQLLNGSHFNFIIVNSPQNPNEPAEVLLSVQKTDTSTPAVAPPVPQQASVLWTPPPDSPPVLPAQYDSSLTAPKEQPSPESLSEMMREKAREIRERVQQQTPPQ